MNNYTATLISLFAFAAIGNSADRPLDDRARPEMRADAELTDVFFIDADQGWTVGDRGAIWTSADGGRHWGPQESGVACRLYSVHFINHQTGWIVGGWTHPYTHRSRGVVLSTKDGGRTWESPKGLVLPLLKRVKFIDSRQGWAICDPSPTYPTGLLYSDDGGRSWSGATGVSGQVWTAGDIGDDGRGTLVSYNSNWSTVNRRRIQSVKGPGLGLAVAHDIKMVGRRLGWCVGDDGNVWQTLDAGQSWQRPAGRCPQNMSRHFDFFTVAAFGTHCWVAGSPGTIVFHSADNGKTWNALPTDQSIPIRGLTFLDENRGWAVGSLGVILSTRDGGRKWRWQRGGASRASIMAVVDSPGSLPLELLARQSADDGYISVAEIIGCAELENRNLQAATLRRRVQEAMVSVGGSAAKISWRFPLRQTGLDLSKEYVTNLWDRVNRGRAMARLEEHLVMRIRQWRPDVLIVPELDPTSKNPLPQLINQTILSAREKAARDDAYRDQLTPVGLKPWRVKKVYSPTSNQREATLQVVTSGLAPHLGRSLSNIAREGRAKLDQTPTSSPTMIGYRMLSSSISADASGRDMFSGMALQPGSESRRFRGQPPAATLDELRRTVQRRRNIEQLLARASEDAQAGMSWLAQVDELTRGLSPAHAAEVYYQLAMQYHEVGESELAADVLQHLVQRFQQHALVEPSIEWLIRYWTSGETRWQLSRRMAGKSSSHAMGSGSNQPANLDTIRRHIPPELQALAEANKVKPATFETSTVESKPMLDYSKKIDSLIKFAAKRHPWIMTDPRLRFPVNATKRNSGQRADATRAFNAMSQSSNRDVWHANARLELWLNKPTRLAPKQLVHSSIASDKPHLDGKLDEKFWQNAKTLKLQSIMRDDDSWPGALMIARDDEFLYVGVACTKSKLYQYTKTNAPRPRDSDLSDKDRIELLIDIDRDYTSFYRMVIDHRGWLAESCAGDSSWNPKWFVAADEDSKQWFIEAAIPFEELAPKAPTSKTAWAIGVQRTVPGVGFQSWSTPAATKPIPAGFGILMFD